MRRPTVTIVLDPWLPFVAVPAAVAYAARPALTHRDVVFADTGGVVTGRRVTRSVAVNDGGRLVFPSKLCGVVYEHLTRTGFPTRVKRLGTPALWQFRPPTDPGPVAEVMRLGGFPFGGLFPAARGLSPERVVPVLLRWAAGLRAVVAVRNRREVRRYVRLLRAAGLSQPVGDYDAVSPTADRPKVLVTSLNWLGHCQPECFDLVVVPDVVPLLGSAPPDPDESVRDRGCYPILWHWQVPAFGFAPAGYTPRGGERLRLLGMFGPVFPAAGGLAPVRVLAYTPPRSGPKTPDDDPLRYKREVVWHNPARNRIVARLANAVASGDPAALAGFGLGGGAHPGPNRVAVLAETTDHAAEIGGYLAGWPVCPAGGDPVPTTGRFIVTESRVAESRNLGVDVLVDARGWGAIDFPGFPPRGADGRGVLLVDVADGGPGVGERQARTRLREYAARGWVVGGPSARKLMR